MDWSFAKTSSFPFNMRKYWFAALALAAVSLCFWTLDLFGHLRLWDVENSVSDAPTTRFDPHQNVKNILFSMYPNETGSWIGENHMSLQALFHCMEQNTCAENQTKIVILSTGYFREAFEGMRRGENIWAFSMMRAMRNLGYTYLFSTSLDQMTMLHRTLSPMVIAIIDWETPILECFRNIKCILNDRNPGGIPIWKFFDFLYWSHESQHPLGRFWILSPEDWPQESGKGFKAHTYIGYSIEEFCHKQPFVPHADRAHQAYILARFLRFFHESWPLEFFKAAVEETGVKMVMGSVDDSSDGSDTDPESSKWITNLGQLPQDTFHSALGKSKVLIGLGNPYASPTPYDALCLGVPFINPVISWDHNYPTDKTRWSVQHGLLKKFDPPYVYNVFLGNRSEFLKAIGDALANPIESFVPENMRMSAVEERVGAFLKKDWKKVAMDILELRISTGEGELLSV